MKIAIKNLNGTLLALLDITHPDEDLKSNLSLEPDQAWRWTTVDPAVGELAAVWTIDSLDYDYRVLFDAIARAKGKPEPAIPEDAVAYTAHVLTDTADLT